MLEARKGTGPGGKSQEDTMRITITWGNGTKATYTAAGSVEDTVKHIILSEHKESFGRVRFSDPRYGTPGTLAQGIAYYHGQGGMVEEFRVTNAN